MTITLTEGPATARAVIFLDGDAQHSTDLGDGLTATVTSIDLGALAPATGAAVRRNFEDAVGAVLEVSPGEHPRCWLKGAR